MNMEVKARDLIAAGRPEGERLGAILRRARVPDATGLSRPGLLAQLEAEYPHALAEIPRRTPAAPLPEAVETGSREEAANVSSARARMLELLRRSRRRLTSA
jgi:hypothetical protein